MRAFKVGDLEVCIYEDSKCATIIKHYNESVKKEIDLNENDIHALNFILSEIKRGLDINLS